MEMISRADGDKTTVESRYQRSLVTDSDRGFRNVRSEIDISMNFTEVESTFGVNSTEAEWVH